jgi:hypothetical protein
VNVGVDGLDRAKIAGRIANKLDTAKTITNTKTVYLCIFYLLFLMNKNVILKHIL